MLKNAIRAGPSTHCIISGFDLQGLTIHDSTSMEFMAAIPNNNNWALLYSMHNVSLNSNMRI